MRVTFVRRKRLPEELEEPLAAFELVLAEVEPAKEALTGVMPTTRLPGRPLADALVEFEDGLERARAAMPGWRCAETESEWTECDRGIAESLSLVRRLHEQAPDIIGFEGLIGAVESLLAPLEPFRAAADRFRSLRGHSR